MPVTELTQLAQSGKLDDFETKCLSALESGTLQLADVASSFQHLERTEQRERVSTLGQMVLENVDVDSDPAAALAIARVALISDAKNAELRSRVTHLYRLVHGDKPGFDKLLEASGLESGRPPRNAIRLLEIALTIQKGDTLVSRTENTVVEVMDVDLESGLFTLRRGGRPNAVSALDLAREFEPIDPDDFRVLRHLRPEKLTALIDDDPLAVVIGLIRAREGMIDQDQLKNELVPRHLDAKGWSKWWTRARAAIRKSPNVIMEGRSPVVLTYCPEGRTVEDESWDAFVAAREPIQWLGTVEAYLREKKSRGEQPCPNLLKRFHDHLVQHIRNIQSRRPGEAFATALVTERLDEQAQLHTDEARQLAVEMLRAADQPTDLIAGLSDHGLWSLALDALLAARPEQAGRDAVRLLSAAPAGAIDRLVKMAAQADSLPAVQSFVDMAAADPLDYPELVYWLWKGPAAAPGLELPSDDELFGTLLHTVYAIGRTLHPSPEQSKTFRHRVKAALSLRDFRRAAECIARSSRERAITLRRQIEMMEGMGDVVQMRLARELRAAHPDLWKTKFVEVKPWDDPDVLWNTQQGIELKQAELDELVNVKMRENAVRIGEAASLGDLSENSEYKFALEERDFLRARLAQINKQMSIARALEPHLVPDNHVGIGHRVTLRNVADGRTHTLTFLGPFDTDPDRGIYNYKAPMAQALMGRRVGERATLKLEDGEAEYEVVALANALLE